MDFVEFCRSLSSLRKFGSSSKTPRKVCVNLQIDKCIFAVYNKINGSQERMNARNAPYFDFHIKMAVSVIWLVAHHTYSLTPMLKNIACFYYSMFFGRCQERRLFMKKELEFLYEGNCNENPFVFETPELQEQMDSVFSYFQKRHAEKGQEALCELCENWQRNAFVVGFQTAVNLLTE